MLIPYSDANALAHLNQEIKSKIGSPPTTEVNVFSTMASAIREVPLALAQMYPHKMTIYYSPGIVNAIDETAKHFSRLGYKVLPLTDATLETASKDTLILLLAEDHPVTGEIFDWSSSLTSATEKKIFTLRVSHHRHQFSALGNTAPSYDVRVLLTTKGKAIAIGGDKTKFTPYFNSALDWSNNDKNDFSLVSECKENQSVIEVFEAAKTEGFETYFNVNQRRIYDRAVIYWRDMDGFAFISELINLSKKNWRLGQDLECTSLCRWSNPLLMNSDPAIVRGLVVISSDILSGGIEKWISDARKNILAKQG